MPVAGFDRLAREGGYPPTERTIFEAKNHGRWVRDVWSYQLSVNIARLTDRAAVVAAIEPFDQLGRSGFLSA